MNWFPAFLTERICLLLKPLEKNPCLIKLQVVYEMIYQHLAHCGPCVVAQFEVCDYRERERERVKIEDGNKRNRQKLA